MKLLIIQGEARAAMNLPPAGDVAHAAWGAEERDQVRLRETKLWRRQ